MFFTQTLKSNGFTLVHVDKSTSISRVILHSVEFTAVEKKFMVGVEFRAKEFSVGGASANDQFTMMLPSITTLNMPAKIHPESKNNEDIEETLDIIITFPGVVLVRSLPYMVKNYDSSTPVKAIPYTVKLFPINTALPAYVIDLGNIFVFSSVESKYARPLTFFKREDIHAILKGKKSGEIGSDLDTRLEDAKRLPVFSDPTTCTTRECSSGGEQPS
jgi:hypothetical protein